MPVPLLNVLIAFSLCVVLLPVFGSVAHSVGLVDYPSDRKRQAMPTPLVGGIVIVLSFFLVAQINPAISISYTMYLWLGVVLVVGVLDDQLDLSYILRLSVHALVVVGIWLTEGLMVNNVGEIFWPSNIISFSVISGLIFTLIAVIGAVNAVNMMDGVDGLIGSLLFVSFCALVYLDLVIPHTRNSMFGAVELAALLGGLVAFLFWNARLFRKTALIYLGDAGSTIMGFLLVYTLIDYSQSLEPVIGPVVAGWILGVPLLDASAVILSRFLSGTSPFEGGRDHLHHLLLDSGVGVNRTVGLLLIAQVCMIIFALTVEQSGFIYSDLVLFWGFILLVALRLIAVPALCLSGIAKYQRCMNE